MKKINFKQVICYLPKSLNKKSSPLLQEFKKNGRVFIKLFRKFDDFWPSKITIFMQSETLRFIVKRDT